VPKFTAEERRVTDGIDASLSIMRITDAEIIAQIKREIKKKITRQVLYNVRQHIKKESYHWYKIMREGQYEYIHEFK
jgi:hypothetical protein